MFVGTLAFTRDERSGYGESMDNLLCEVFFRFLTSIGCWWSTEMPSLNLLRSTVNDGKLKQYLEAKIGYIELRCFCSCSGIWYLIYSLMCCNSLVSFVYRLALSILISYAISVKQYIKYSDYWRWWILIFIANLLIINFPLLLTKRNILFLSILYII